MTDMSQIRAALSSVGLALTDEIVRLKTYKEDFVLVSIPRRCLAQVKDMIPEAEVVSRQEASGDDPRRAHTWSDTSASAPPLDTLFEEGLLVAPGSPGNHPIILARQEPLKVEPRPVEPSEPGYSLRADVLLGVAVLKK